MELNDSANIFGRLASIIILFPFPRKEKRVTTKVAEQLQ